MATNNGDVICLEGQEVPVRTLADWLTDNSMEQSCSWEAKSNSASQELLRLLCTPKVHYRVHNSPPLIPILSQMHPVHNFPPCFRKIHSNIILPYTPRPSEWFFCSGFSTKIFYAFHISPMSDPFHPPLCAHPNNIWWGVQVTKLLIMQSWASHHFLTLRSKNSPQHPVLKRPQFVLLP
jgi:hypothetical protein